MFEILLVKFVCVCVMVTAEGKVDAVTFGTGSGGTLAGKRST